MIEVKSPRNPIMADGYDGDLVRERKEQSLMLDNYFLDKLVRVYL